MVLLQLFFRHFSARSTMAWLGFFGTLTVYFCRLNLSISIVSMTKTQRISTSSAGSDNVAICSAKNQSGQSHFEGTVTGDFDFDWNIGAQGDILACYYYGYILTQESTLNRYHNFVKFLMQYLHIHRLWVQF